MQVVGITPTADARRAVEHHIAEFKRQLQVHLTGGVYMNFLEGKEARQRTPDAYAATKYDRLKALKAAYDPDNRFRFGFNIPPVKQA
jgi:FAD/FMN-containing dehydrogenase